MRNNRRISIFLTWLVLIISPFPLIVILNRGLIDTPEHLLAYDLGIVAYVWWLMIVLMSTRPHWLVQRIGMPALYAIHGALGIMALIAATIHRFTSFSMFPLIKQTGNIAWYLEMFLLAYAVLFLSGWLVDRIHHMHDLKQWIEHHLLNHQVTMWIHRLNFVVIALIWLHVHLIPRLGMVPGFRITFDFYTVITIIGFCWWKLKVGRYYPSATVQRNIPISSNMQELTLKFANQNEEYQAGDFYFLSFRNVKGLSKEPHPFSVSSAPKSSPDTASFTIHRLGDFTRQIEKIPTGTKVKLEGPFGLFDREIRSDDSPLILYGLGSGIVPLISLAQQYAGTKQLHLIWSGPQINNLYYKKALTELEKQGVKINTQLHRFTSTDLIQSITSTELKTAKVIIVGSSARVLAVRRSLMKLGFNKQKLIDERMTL